MLRISVSTIACERDKEKPLQKGEIPSLNVGYICNCGSGFACSILSLTSVPMISAALRKMTNES